MILTTCSEERWPTPNSRRRRSPKGSLPTEELRQIRAVAIRGSEIVRQLMIFAGKERGTLEPVDVSSLVSEMLELLKVSISKHAVLKTSLGKGLPAVRGNAAQIRQVVMNLVTNASEAIGERDGVIRVLTERVTVGSGSNVPEAKNLPEGDYLRMEVSDTGCGMTPEDATQALRSVLYDQVRRPGHGARGGTADRSPAWRRDPCRELGRRGYQRPDPAAVHRGDGSRERRQPGRRSRTIARIAAGRRGVPSWLSKMNPRCWPRFRSAPAERFLRDSGE